MSDEIELKPFSIKREDGESDIELRDRLRRKEENKRLREALETICAIYEINGAEWRFDKRLYDVAKEALDNGSESRD